MAGKVQAIEELSGVPLRELKREIMRIVGDIRMIVFGSYAMGDFSSESDIDLLIILNKDLPSDLECRINQTIKEFGKHHRVPISAIIIGKGDLKRRPIPIVKRAEEEGIEIE